MDRRRRRMLPSAPGTPQSERSRASSSSSLLDGNGSPSSRRDSLAQASGSGAGSPERVPATNDDLLARADAVLGPSRPANERREADEDMQNQNVVVSVRVRPFNEREIRAGLPLVVTMEGNKTTLENAETGKVHEFFYDHSFWSCSKDSPDFIGQEDIYKKMARPLLGRALEGYNCCLFAYGQTGSGKSYSMMGYHEEHGVIPRFSNDLFSRIDAQTECAFKVEISYFEIYSERIYDLLVPGKPGGKQKLKVREHPILGPYVEGLTAYAALSYSDVESWINVGGKHRATASTNMNATSSRSHAVFTMTVTQTMEIEGEERSKVSKINLVDLAGSERSDAAGTTGVRLKEASAINKSLHTLGRIISFLAEKSTKRKKIFIPYRDSVLTWILKESLGGNAKTAMLATISPSFDNYDETLSTLRYAAQARQIVNEAVINEDPNLRLIRELREELERLRGQYGDSRGAGAALAEVQTLREKLSTTEKLMENMKRTWEEKLAMAEKMREENAQQLEKQGISKDARKLENILPNLVNLNEDPQLSEMLLYVIQEGTTKVGSQDSCDVTLGGVFVRPDHCTIFCSEEHEMTLTGGSDSLTYVNGVQVGANETVNLHHGDRIIFGNNHFFRLNIPRYVAVRRASNLPVFSEDSQVKDYQYAKEELERVQTARIEAELEAEHKRKTEAILSQLESAKGEAKAQLEQQKQAYEQRIMQMEIERLAKQRTEEEQRQAAEQALMQAHEEERQRVLSELEEQKRQFEQDKLRLEAEMEAEKAKARTKMEEEAAAKNKVISELEAEKARIEQDVLSLKEANERRKQARQELQAVSKGVTPMNAGDVKKGEWLRISVLIKEANAIAAGLKKNTVFRRADDYLDDGEGAVKVSNTKLNISTIWPLEKFEARLFQMRELFYNETDAISPEEAESLFYDPDDDWKEETDGVSTETITERAFPLLRRHTTTELTEPNDQFNDMIRALKAEVKARRHTDVANQPDSERKSFHTPDTIDESKDSELDAAKSYEAIVQQPSVSLLCRHYVKNSISSLKSSQQHHSSSTDAIITSVSALKTAADCLLDSFEESAMGDGDGVPLREQGSVRNASISAALSVEVLCSTIRSARASAESGVVADLLDRLASHTSTTANNVTKLLQGLENGIETMVRVGHREVLDDINLISMAAGELAIATARNEGDEEEYDEDEEMHAMDGHGAYTGFTTQMVEVGSMTPRSSSVDLMNSSGGLAAGMAVDRSILAAFERGTHAHVEKSMEGLTQDMDAQIEQLLRCVEQLQADSNVNAPILQSAAEVVRYIREALKVTQLFQMELAKERETSSSTTFYRKNYSRAKGVVNEAQEVGDAIVELVNGCTSAVSGGADVEQVMSHVKQLRGALAHLVSTVDNKTTQRSLERGKLAQHLHDESDNVFRASKVLTSECQSFAGTAQGKLRRSISLRKRNTALTPSRLSTPAKPDGLSQVQRRRALLEKQADILRLQTELEEAQREYKSLNQSAYDREKPEAGTDVI